MLLETAVDPECFTRAEITHFLLYVQRSNRVVLSKVPRKWHSQISKSMDGLPHSPSVTVRLADFVKSGRIVGRPEPISPLEGDTWTAVARKEHVRLPFAAIVSAQRSHDDGGTEFFSLNEAIESQSSPFDAPTGLLVQQTCAAFCESVAPLLRHSVTVFFVDPYLGGNNEKALLAILSSIREGKRMRSRLDGLEVVLCTSAKENENPVATAGNIRRFMLKAGVEKEAKMKIAVLPDVFEDGQRNHDRFVLTKDYGISMSESILPGRRENPDSQSVFNTLDARMTGSRFSYYEKQIQRAEACGRVFEVKHEPD
jgi:hypothetical protein